MTRPRHDRRSSSRRLAIALALSALALAWSVVRPGHAQEIDGGSMLRSAPFDRITLIDGSSIDVEPVSPRPLPAFDPKKEKDRRYGTGLRPPREGNVFLPGEKPKGPAPGEKEDEFASEIMIHLLKGEARDYKLKRGNIKRIEYFEDMLLAEADRYLLARDYTHAFECDLRVQSRNPGWSGLDERVNHLLFEEGSAALLDGSGENGLRILGELAARRADYPGLADRLATAYGSRIARAYELGLYASGRRVLHDLEPLAPTHPIVRDARARFMARAKELVGEATRHEGAERLDALTEALRVWPELEGVSAQYSAAFADVPTLDVAVIDTSRSVGPWVRSPADERLTRLLYLPILATADEDAAQGRRSGQLAARLESTDLGRKLSIQVRPSLPWSDLARPVSAVDVANALAARAEPRSLQYSARWANLLDRVEAIDESRVEFRLSRPFLKPEAWLMIPVGPVDAVVPDSTRNSSQSQSQSQGRPVVGNGPYRCQSATERGIVLRAGDDPGAPGRPRIVRIRETVHPGGKAAVGSLLRGEVSLVAHVPADRVAELAATPDLKVGRYSQPSVHWIAFDGRDPALRNRTLRRGLSYAIDRKTLLEETLLRRPVDDVNRASDGVFARGSYADAIDVKPLDYDPLLARMLIAAARKELGGDPIKLTLEYPAAPGPQAIVARLVEAFGAAGIEVAAVERPESELETELRSGRKFALAYRAMSCVEPVLEAGKLICPGIDAPAEIDPLSSVASPRILQLLLQLERAPEWPTAKGLALQIDRECRDELPVLPLWQVADHYAWRTRLVGPGAVTDQLYQGITTWEIAPWFARDPW
jgi:peptide/nickel transport system substrate-binding protein